MPAFRQTTVGSPRGEAFFLFLLVPFPETDIWPARDARKRDFVLVFSLAASWPEYEVSFSRASWQPRRCFSLRSSMALRATSASISGCLFVAGSGIWLPRRSCPQEADVTDVKPGNGLRLVNNVGVAGALQEKRSQEFSVILPASDLSLQAATGLLSYLAIVWVC